MFPHCTIQLVVPPSALIFLLAILFFPFRADTKRYLKAINMPICAYAVTIPAIEERPDEFHIPSFADTAQDMVNAMWYVAIARTTILHY